MFKSIKIKTKVFMGFGAILVLFAAVAGLGYNSLVTIGHEMDEYSHEVEEAEAVASVESHFFELEIFVREFAATSNMEDVTKAREIATKLRAEITATAKLFKNPEQLEKLAEISKDFEIYVKDFEKVVVLDVEFEKLIHEVLDPAADSFIQHLDQLLEEAVAEGNSDAAVYIAYAREHSLEAEVYANIMIGRKDDSFTEKVHHEFDEVHAALKAVAPTLRTDQERQHFATLSAEFETYINAFEKVVEDEHEISNLVHHEMDEAATELIADAEWIVARVHAETEAVKAETHATIELAELEMLILAIGGLGLGIVLAWTIGNGLSKPVVGMTEAMERLAAGDLEAEIPAQGRGDEIGNMSGAVQVFKDNAIAMKRMEVEAEQSRLEHEKRSREDRLKLADEFEGAVMGIVQSVGDAAGCMSSSAEQMRGIADHTTERVAAVTTASTQASTNVQSVATAAEQMSASVQEISRQVSSSSEISDEAVAESHRATEQVPGLADASQKIGDVVSLISDIANQTNLLALNATIEGISKTIAEISEIGNSISAAVEEQGASTQEIARNVQEAAQGTEEVNVNISDVNDGARETGTAAGQVLEATNDLSKQAADLRQEIDNFLTTVRAA